MYKIFKRFFDFIISLIFLPLLLVITLFVGIAIKINDRGPIFYKAKRVGYRGEIFNMIKFRSMKVNAPDLRYEDGSTYNSDDDLRVTEVGRFLRKTSIDELPQLVNVFAGKMSLIGPRPDSADYLPKYTEEEKIILTVRPGITGYNQAINRNSVLTKEKLKNDIYYVKNMSLKLDIKIIFITIKEILFSKNIYRNANSEVINQTAKENKKDENNNDIRREYTSITSNKKS